MARVPIYVSPLASLPKVPNLVPTVLYVSIYAPENPVNLVNEYPAPSYTSKFAAGDDVPTPNRLLLLSQYRFAFELKVLDPLQNANLVAVPLPPTLLLNVFQSVDVSNPLLDADEDGTLRVNVPDDVMGDPLTLISVPLAPVVNPTDVTVPAPAPSAPLILAVMLHDPPDLTYTSPLASLR